MIFSPYRRVALGLAMLGMAGLAHANSFQGTAWSLTYDSAALPDTDPLHETYRVTLSVDTNGYTGTGKYIDQVAIKVSSSVFAASLVDAPGGASMWQLVQGGLAANGCRDNGSSFECVNSTSSLNGGKGVVINPSPDLGGIDYAWVFDITVNNGGLFSPPKDASVKARFVDANGSKVGDLVSEHVALSAVPLPGTFSMVLAGLGVLAGIARRKTSA